MPRPPIHPVVALVLIGIWLLLVTNSVSQARVQAVQQQQVWLELANRQVMSARPLEDSGWRVVHRPPDCMCETPRNTAVMSDLRAMNVRLIAVDVANTSHDLVIINPEGRVVYAGGVSMPTAAFCSTSIASPAEAINAGWLDADNPIVDRPTACRCAFAP